MSEQLASQDTTGLKEKSPVSPQLERECMFFPEN